MPKANFPYSQRRGDSVYPIEAGTVVRLKKPKLLLNHKAERQRIEHEVYVWIQSYYKTQITKRGPQRRQYVRVWTCDRPLLPQYRWAYILREKRRQVETIIAWMRDFGFEVVARDIKFQRKISNYQPVYEAVGLFQK